MVIVLFTHITCIYHTYLEVQFGYVQNGPARGGGVFVHGVHDGHALVHRHQVLVYVH